MIRFEDINTHDTFISSTVTSIEDVQPNNWYLFNLVEFENQLILDQKYDFLDCVEFHTFKAAFDGLKAAEKGDVIALGSEMIEIYNSHTKKQHRKFIEEDEENNF